MDGVVLEAPEGGARCNFALIGDDQDVSGELGAKPKEIPRRKKRDV